MRAAPLALVLSILAAGCAGEPADPAPAARTTPAYAAPSPTPAATPTAPTAPPAESGPRLGVLFERTHDFDGQTNETRLRFDVEPGVDKLILLVESAGPPEDGSFTSAVMDLYPPGYTSPLFAELPGQEKRSYTREMYADGFYGEWMVRFDGTGKTSVTLRVSAE